MIEPRVTTHIPKIVIKTPEDVSFWRAVGIEAAKDIEQRTLSGVDADKRAFKPYARSTIEFKKKTGRSTSVNLNQSGRMTKAIPRGVKPSKHGVKLQLTGEEGFKAYNIKFNQKRNFFSFNVADVEKIIKKIRAWMRQKNS